jgi:type I restriction enzyme M protein
MGSRITQQNLESYLWGAAVLLRGTIDAGDYKQFIFPLLFYKRLCDVFDEETVTALRESGGDQDFALFPENHRFQIPTDAHWREIRKVSRDVGRGLQQAMRAIETANPDKLFGIFGDAQWTNKDRLSDAMLRDLIEHFSTLELTVANLPEDELGQGYEYLIKKFADDSGHTAAEFYTNRTVVHLMTEMLDVQPGESVYDPTCGSGGMLLSCIAHLRNQKKEWRNVKLYGQERNLMTSSIARMNCFLHGIEDFRIERGDTLAEPKLVEGDRLQRFDVVLANPPYSIKQWNREAFAADPWGRNVFGVPPQGRADYAFQQHILQSLREKSGRSIALWPHGLLSREEESEIRKKLVATDQVEAVVGLGRKLFYNSGMESCLFVSRKQKSKSRKGKILFINAEDLVTRERAQSFLSTTDIETILAAYRSDKPVPGISAFATLQEVLNNNGNLNIKLYVSSSDEASESGVVLLGNQLGLSSWITSATALRNALEDVIPGASSSQLDVMEAVHSSKAPLFDRSSWKRVRLGDVATEYAERVDNPSESGFERYIGSDCIDKHDFRVRRWDPAESVKSSMKAFRVGDYLLVRRSLYGSDFRERAPRANFDGICSADILTIRENPDHIADGFLIAILYSKGLWEFVVQHAKGSLTRRIKWRELASFEFDLPPLDQQRRIAEILWAVDEANEANLALLPELKAYQQAVWDAHKTESDVKTVRIGDVAVVANGSTPSKAEDRYWTGGTFPWLPTGKVHDRFITTGGDFITEAALKERKARVFPKGSVLVAMIGQGKTRGCAALMEIEASVNQNFACIVPRDIESYYLFYALDFSYEALRRSSHGSNQEALNCGLVANFPVPCASRKRQAEIAAEMKDCEHSQKAIERHCASSATIFTEFINTIFPV